MTRPILWWHRIKRAYRAEFGPPQHQWVRLTMPYPEIIGAVEAPAKTLSVWALAEYSTQGVAVVGPITGVQVEYTHQPPPYVETDGSIWAPSTHVEMNPAFEQDTKGWTQP